MDKVEFTPRFHKSGNSNKSLCKDDLPDKKIQTCKNISKFKRKSHKSNKTSESIQTPKSRKSYKSRKSNAKSMGHLAKKSIKTANILTIKNKFFLRNDFDRKHSKQFLEEKYAMLEKPVLFDDICN